MQFVVRKTSMHRRELLVAGLILAALSLWIGVSFWRFDWDDCYITYRIAENIANGKGWVYPNVA